MAGMTLYDVLEVRTDATPADLRVAYRELAMENHPDQGGSAKAMAAINEAYAVLRDPETRRAYDRQLAAGRRAPSRTERNERAAPRGGDLRPPRRPAPPRRPEPSSRFEAAMWRIAEAALRELDREVAESAASRVAGRPVTLAEILEATEDRGASRPPRRGPATGRGR